jgi:CRISPR system Cascade subunit CasE
MTLYLSQVHIGKGEAVRAGLRDGYAWHKALWAAFPDRDGEARRFLFRVDDGRDSFRVLLLSPERPVVPEWGSWQTKLVREGFLEHDRYLFQLRANPTIKRIVRDEAGERQRNGPRTAIYDAEGLTSWLERKAGQSGFAVLESVAGPPLSSFFVKDGKRGKHVGVDFTGLLEVVDTGAFTRAFTNGIGPAKAFGFGLLMLQPVE